MPSQAGRGRRSLSIRMLATHTRAPFTAPQAMKCHPAPCHRPETRKVARVARMSLKNPSPNRKMLAKMVS